MGNEIKDVHELEYDQEVWLSFGEPFKNPFSRCSHISVFLLIDMFNYNLYICSVFVVTASFDKMRAFKYEGRDCMIREQLMAEDVMDAGG